MNHEGMVLTSWAQEERDQFESEYGIDGNCSCHLSAPCGSCTHPGNPRNQEEDSECWTHETPLRESEDLAKDCAPIVAIPWWKEGLVHLFPAENTERLPLATIDYSGATDKETLDSAMMIARRFVASVAATKGTDLEKLEAMVSGGYTVQGHSKYAKGLEEQIAALTKQRDELLSALGEIGNNLGEFAGAMDTQNRCLTPHHLQIAPHCVADSHDAVFLVWCGDVISYPQFLNRFSKRTQPGLGSAKPNEPGDKRA